MSRLPLTGVRVIDLTRLLPGAYATLLIADLGADVVKIEDPRGGDPSRTLPQTPRGTHAYFELLNRNKRSVTLDLRAPAAAPVLDGLLARAHILVQSFRPHTARRLGVDAETLCGRHPALIHASVSGFGRAGPLAERAAHDINFEALAGLLEIGARASTGSGRASSDPRVPGMLIADVGAALNATAGILAALYQRERTGAGSIVDVAIHDAALAWLLFPAARRLAGDDSSVDLPISGENACYNIYRTADDRFVALGALEPKFWAAFCDRIGRADLGRLQYARGEEQARALAEVRALMRTRTRAEWLSFFGDLDVCLTPVLSVAEALSDPQLVDRGVVVRHESRTYLTSPVTIASSLRVPIRPAPALGAHTDEVLAEAGLTDADRVRLREAGVI